MGKKPSEIIHEFGMQGGLKVRGLSAFGLYRRYLVALNALSGGLSFFLFVGFPRKEDSPQIAERIDAKDLLKMVDSMGQAKVEPGLVSITFTPKWKVPDATKIKALLDTVVDIVSTTTGPFDNSCEECSSSDADTILINGIPTLQCSSCLGKLRQQAESDQAAFEAFKPDYVRGITYAFGAVIVSAVIWGLIAYVFQVFFFFAGFVIGFFIGYTLTYGTKKTTGVVIGLAMGLTILAVVLGEIFYVAFVLIGDGISLVYLLDAFGFYLQEAPQEFFGAVFTGIIGAGIIAYNLWAGGKDQRVSVEIIT